MRGKAGEEGGLQSLEDLRQRFITKREDDIVDLKVPHEGSTCELAIHTDLKEFSEEAYTSVFASHNYLSN
jgi:hypothetical protein